MQDFNFHPDSATPARLTQQRSGPVTLRGDEGSFAQLVHGRQTVRASTQDAPHSLTEQPDDIAPEETVGAASHASKHAEPPGEPQSARDELADVVPVPDLRIQAAAKGEKHAQAFGEMGVVAALPGSGDIPGKQTGAAAMLAGAGAARESGMRAALRDSMAAPVAGRAGQPGLTVEQTLGAPRLGPTNVEHVPLRDDLQRAAASVSRMPLTPAARFVVPGANFAQQPVSVPGGVAASEPSARRPTGSAMQPAVQPGPTARAGPQTGPAPGNIWRNAAAAFARPDGALPAAAAKPNAVVQYQGWQGGLLQPLQSEIDPMPQKVAAVSSDGLVAVPVPGGGAATAPSWAPASAPATGPGPPVQQIAQAFAQASGERFDVQLSPEELGRVRIQLQPSEAGLHVVITTERPETLDFLRKNIAQLSRELSDLGLGDASYEFADDGRDGRHGQTDNARTRLQGQSEDLAAVASGDMTVRPVAVNAGLDLRF